MPCCTPTPTPTMTPSQTPSNTPTRSAPGKGRGLRGNDSGRPPVPVFSSRFSPPRVQTVAPNTAAAVAAIANKEAGSSSPPLPECGGPGGPCAELARAVGPKTGGREGGREVTAGERKRGMLGGAGAATAGLQPPGQGRNLHKDKASQAVPSIESEVATMLDESHGTLGLVRDGLGDERVPFLSLERLKDVYRTGRGSVRSWRATSSSIHTVNGAEAATALIEVEEGRLGVFSSSHAYLVEFKEIKSCSPKNSLEQQQHQHQGHQQHQLASINEAEAKEDWVETHIVYLWKGREAAVETCAAARLQGQQLTQRYPRSTGTSRAPLLEVEQGCEPVLFLALFSYMLPPLVAVVLQGHDETPDLRVLELQESPCFYGSGVVIAVEGPCSASILAKHGPLPDRSYICLVRPSRRTIRGASEMGGVDLEAGGGSVGTFDAAYYWHGVDETPAVEEVGILLCQQVDRMFPSPSFGDCGRRKKRYGRKRRCPGVGLGGGLMRGFVADVKLGLPVPDGFWECLLPEGSTSRSIFASEGRGLRRQDLCPERRSRPVRVFGVCEGSRKARQSFVWEVTTGGMPSQMRLSPSLSHVVDAGASHVYVWHGNGSNSDGRRLACRVARAYAARVGCGTSAEEVEAGSEPVGLLDCFIGWDEALVEPPPMLSLSPGRRYSHPEDHADEVSPLVTPTTSAPLDDPWSSEGKLSACGAVQHLDNQQRRVEPSSPGDRRASSRSVSSGYRLTPPGQRTPRVNLDSPMSLKLIANEGMYPPLHLGAAAGGLSPDSDVVSSPSRRSYDATHDEVPGCAGCGMSGTGGFASPPRLLGLTSCLEVFTPHQTAKTTPSDKSRPDALPSLCCSGIISTMAPSMPGDVSLRSDAVHPPPEAATAGSSDSERDGWCTRGAGAEVGTNITTAGQQCAEKEVDSSAGNDNSQRESSGGEGRGGNEKGDSGRDENEEEKGDFGGRKGGDRGRGGGRGRGARGGDAGASDDTSSHDGKGISEEGVDGDEDGEDEAEVRGADKERDTVLRLSEVEFCEGIEYLQGRGVSSEVSTSEERLDSSSCVSDNGGGAENSSVLSRHLSDFFRSPFALDSMPMQRYSSMRSLFDVQPGALLFDSVKSIGSEDHGAPNRNRSGKLFDSEKHADSLCSAVSVTSEVVTKILINGGDIPRFSADAAANPPEIYFAEALAAKQRNVIVAPPLPVGESENAPVAVSDHLGRAAGGEATVGPVVVEMLRVSTLAESVVEGAEQAGHGDWGVSMDGDGDDSEEERVVSGSTPSDVATWLGKETHKQNAAPASNHVEEPHVAEAASTVEATSTAVVRHWAGLNDDGSWRTEVARRAAGEAGAVEAERRRLAKIGADESWRSDAGQVDGRGCGSRRNIRRESVTRLQTGNVRDKLSAFEASSGSNNAKETADNRSSIGALQGRGLVSAWTKRKCTVRTLAASTARGFPDPSPGATSGKSASLSTSENPARSSACSAEGQQTLPSPTPVDLDEADEEFVWKAGPAPCRLQGRPSLGLIRNGQVRIMAKALMASCPEAGGQEAGGSAKDCDGSSAKVDTSQNGTSFGESVETVMPSTPLPRPLQPPRQTVMPNPLPAQLSPAGSKRAEQRPCPPRPAAARGDFWLAKAGLNGTIGNGVASAPSTPPSNGGAWQQGGGTRSPPPPYMAARATDRINTAAIAGAKDSLASRFGEQTAMTGVRTKAAPLQA